MTKICQSSVIIMIVPGHILSGIVQRHKKARTVFIVKWVALLICIVHETSIGGTLMTGGVAFLVMIFWYERSSFISIVVYKYLACQETDLDPPVSFKCECPPPPPLETALSHLRFCFLTICRI